MAVHGELIHGAGGSPALPGPAGGVFDDVVGRLRPYVTPPAPKELARPAGIGAGMTIAAAALFAILPAGESIWTSSVFKWFANVTVGHLVDASSVLAAPAAFLALLMAAGIAIVYGFRWGSAPALAFLSAQAWIGVAALSVAGLVWATFLLVLLINVVVWTVYIVVMVLLGLLACALVLAVIGAAASG
jgi:hypothetical protein